MEGPIDIENAIIDKLGKGDIKWKYKLLVWMAH